MKPAVRINNILKYVPYLSAKKKNYPNYKGQLIIAVWGNNRSLF
jgi:hypothetical protein